LTVSQYPANELERRIMQALGDDAELNWLEQVCYLISAARARKHRMRMHDAATVGARIQLARECKGMSAREFGRRVKLSHVTIRNVETGIQPLAVSRLARFAELLEVSQEWLVMLTDEGGPTPVVMAMDTYKKDKACQRKMGLVAAKKAARERVRELREREQLRPTPNHKGGSSRRRIACSS
jgi:transcriptional regulator with XRE-family HTH domain